MKKISVLIVLLWVFGTGSNAADVREDVGKQRCADPPSQSQLQEAVLQYNLNVIKHTRADTLTSTPQWVWDFFHQIQKESLDEAKRYAEGKIWMVKQVPSEPGSAYGDETETGVLFSDLMTHCKLALQDIPGWSPQRQAEAVVFWQSWQNRQTGRFYNPRLMDPQHPTPEEGVCNEKYVVGILNTLGAKPKYPLSTVAEASSDGKAGRIDTTYFIKLSRSQLTTGDCSHIGLMCVEIMKAIDEGCEEYIPVLEKGIENIMAQQNPENGLWDARYKDELYSDYSPTAGAFKILVRLHGYLGMENVPHMERLADILIEKQPFFLGVPSVTRNTSDLMISCLENSDYRRADLLEALRKNVQGLKGKDRSNYVLFCLGMVGDYLWKDCPFHDARRDFNFSRGTAYKYRIVIQPDGHTVKIVKKEPEECVTHPDYQFRLYCRKMTPGSSR